MAIEVTIPRLGWSMESGVFGQWLKSDGETITVGDPLFSIDGEKATEEVESLDAGILHIRSDLAKSGEELTVGTVIGWLLAEGESIPVSPPISTSNRTSEPETMPRLLTKTADSPTSVGKLPSGELSSSPRARRLARQLGIDWRIASGSGKGGRIRECDIQALASGLDPETGPQKTFVPRPSPYSSGPVEIIPLNAERRLQIERLVSVSQNVPLAFQLGTADTTELEAFRQRYQSRVRIAGASLSMLAILTKIVATSLKVFPHCNVNLDETVGHLLRKKYYHIGIGVDVDHGFLFPVIRNVDQKNLSELSVEITDLVNRARLGSLAPRETSGACMSIYQPEVQGDAELGHFTPIINPPEPMILGVTPIQRIRLLHDQNSQVLQQLQMPLSLTYDCRVINGTDGMEFLQWIIEAIEEPLLLSLEG